MKKLAVIFVLVLTFSITSCKKSAGEGGNSSIKGNVWAENWNGAFTILTSEGVGANVDVFIIYGDETSYGDKISASPDGTFEFRYLRPGSYKVYAYSKTTNSISATGKVAVLIDAEITKKKQVVDVGKITVKV